MYQDKFKKFGGEFIPNIVEYLMEIYKDQPNITIAIGNDSIQKRRRTMYATTIMVYNNNVRNGAHVVFYRDSVPKIFDTFTRLYKEADYMNELGVWLDNQLREAGFVRNDINDDERRRYKFIQMLEKGEHKNLPLHEHDNFIKNIHLTDEEKNKEYKLIDIHLDLNPSEWSYNRRYNKSYKVYESAVPWLRGYDFRVYPKPLSYAATSAADLLLK